MNDWLDKMLEPLADLEKNLPQVSFEAFDKAYARHLRCRRLRRGASIALVLLLLAPGTMLLLRRGSGSAIDTVQQDGRPLLAEAIVPESVPQPMRETAPVSLSATRRNAPMVRPVAPVKQDEVRDAVRVAEPENVREMAGNEAALEEQAVLETEIGGTGLAPDLQRAETEKEMRRRGRKARLSVSGFSSSGLVSDSYSVWETQLSKTRTSVHKRAASVPPSSAKYSHYAPFSVGVSGSLQMKPSWRLNTGAHITVYPSIYELGGEKQQQSICYLGIPLRLDRIWMEDNNRYSLYLGGGALVEKGIVATVAEKKQTPDGWYGSLTASLGFQYNLKTGLGLYVEPSCDWTLLEPEQPLYDTYRTGHPVLFRFQAGVRIAINQ